MNSLDLGPEYSDNEIEEALIRSSFKSIVPIDLASTVAEFIAEGKIVCWFEGKMEMGARALGSRSILANPQIPSIPCITKTAINVGYSRTSSMLRSVTS